MKASELDEIIAAAPEKMREILGELHEHILEGAAQALTQSQETEGGGKPKVAVSLKLVIGLNTALPSWQVKGAVGVNYTAESAPEMLDDPRQQALPFSNVLGPGDSVGMTTGGKGVRLSKDKTGKVSAEKVGGEA